MTLPDQAPHGACWSVVGSVGAGCSRSAATLAPRASRGSWSIPRAPSSRRRARPMTRTTRSPAGRNRIRWIGGVRSPRSSDVSVRSVTCAPTISAPLRWRPRSTGSSLPMRTRRRSTPPSSGSTDEAPARPERSGARLASTPTRSGRSPDSTWMPRMSRPRSCGSVTRIPISTRALPVFSSPAAPSLPG